MKRFYSVEYGSSALMPKEKRIEYTIYSNKKLNIGDTIIIKSKGGFILCRVIDDISDVMKERYGNLSEEQILNKAEHREFIEKVDLKHLYEEPDKMERKEELRKEMESKFKELDKELKFKYYAEQDDDFKKLFEEYSKL